MSEHPRSVDELIHALDQGRRFAYLPFWRPEPTADGSLGASCLSQWWPAAFEIDGTTFATAEHYMMWRKAELFGDTATATRILAAAEPGRAKEHGRQVRDFDRTRWAEHRYEVVVTGNTAKFSQHPRLGEFLAGTGDQVLVEASPADTIWGIGLAADDPRLDQPDRWPGLNLIGFALADVRARVRSADRHR
ncbi:NADAR family protein [Actinokineospora enzanensis]|uniref:NADAR family protein n=1 Tax=Actinokineospora enzanensis TaxID=155975 RepID=UPI00037DF577|nr:NADAR family protein [Actinokineospora enzanensis]